MKSALITGVAGQDGTYMAKYLTSLGYKVYGFVRHNPHRGGWLTDKQLMEVDLLYGDMREPDSLVQAVRKAWPDEIYNFAGQTFVPTSWHAPGMTMAVNAGGLGNLLRAVELVKADTKVYQASSSEMFGNGKGACNEDTPMQPTSPYGISKLAAHKLCQVYRERDLFVVGGICFNHESPLRGPEMVTRKITMAVARWACGDNTPLRLGSLKAERDWGFAGDYVQAMHRMLQEREPRDYVIGTGVSTTVGAFLAAACESVGFHDYDHLVIDGDPRFVRTAEIHTMVADPALASRTLSWVPEVDVSALAGLMVEEDIVRLDKPQVYRFSKLPEGFSRS